VSVRVEVGLSLGDEAMQRGLLTTLGTALAAKHSGRVEKAWRTAAPTYKLTGLGDGAAERVRRAVGSKEVSSLVEREMPLDGRPEGDVAVLVAHAEDKGQEACTAGVVEMGPGHHGWVLLRGCRQQEESALVETVATAVARLGRVLTRESGEIELSSKPAGEYHIVMSLLNENSTVAQHSWSMPQAAEELLEHFMIFTM